MESKYREYRNLNLVECWQEMKEYWQQHDIFQKNLEKGKNHPAFIFYEGPPSANGKPGIHHVLSRTIKDIFCRYKTLKGFLVDRKAGWDTHGLPVEISVEKTLNITKEDIGKTISVEDYNKACRQEVMKYKDIWDQLTIDMGYWVDLDHPYITFENKYVETVWHLLSKLYEKGLIYKGYTIQPYSPAAGTGLSSHELNLPGCYKDVKDNTVVAQFKVVRDASSEKLFSKAHADVYFLAWTTTPWTLPSNTALALGASITYLVVDTFNPYTHLPVSLILAKDLFAKYFDSKNAEISFADYQPGQKHIPFRIVDEFKGSELDEIRYEQLLPYAQPETGDAFRVVMGDFVTTEDGTGIVHIAPSFGADDFKVARQYGVGALTLVDKQGRFTSEMGEFAGRYVKNEYDPAYNPEQPVDNVDIDIIVKLKKENKAFKIEKYEHSYPHCWRTDKPILYYPLDSWFIRTTAYKDRMIELNKTINWKPAATGTGRFGNWLENLVDWNLSRSRFWGVALPIWTSEDRTEQICIGSVSQLKSEIQKSIQAGLMKDSPYLNYKENDNTDENYHSFDIHRPYVDEVILVSPSGKPMFREPDLIDVWFDSGAMPYAQFHYPFENADLARYYPADFIAEGVDQTRGWFFTLHAIAVMLFDSVSYKTVISNGLVLDKEGNKMSKRLGNTADPFEIINTYGPDALRWYMTSNNQPWDNLKFDKEGIGEVQRKFFGTLYNTYTFFAIYANIDEFRYSEAEIPAADRTELDRWILSELNTLIKNVDEYFADYEPTKAARAIMDFVDEHLSNWYVRLSRRRFWKGEYTTDKIAAYQTLYQCLESLAIISSPIAPFFMDRLFLDLNNISGRYKTESVHNVEMPVANESLIDKNLEERMELAQTLSSMVLSLRKKSNIRVRQPLSRILIPVLDPSFKDKVELIRHLILSEVNVKTIEYVGEDSSILVKKIKANFKTLGPKFGKLMKQIAASITAMNQKEIRTLETSGKFSFSIESQVIEIGLEDVEIVAEDIPGWTITSNGTITVALDINISEDLAKEGIARDLINRIQNLRKDNNFEVTDRISVHLEQKNDIIDAVNHNYKYICSETLADQLLWVENTPNDGFTDVELADNLIIKIKVDRIV